MRTQCGRNDKPTGNINRADPPKHETTGGLFNSHPAGETELTVRVIHADASSSQRVQQSFDLRVLKLNDRLRTLIGEATDGGEQDVSRLEQEGHG